MKPRENPFRVEKLHGLRFRFQNSDWDEFFAKLEAQNYRGAIVGPHGSGKTTLMLELHERLLKMGCPANYLRINSETRHAANALVHDWLETASQDQVLLLDGAEQLRCFPWRRFQRQAESSRGLIITTHRTGRLPTLYQTQTDVDLLTNLVAELDGKQSAARSTLTQLFTKHRGNVRECLRTLYEEAMSK